MALHPKGNLKPDQGVKYSIILKYQGDRIYGILKIQKEITQICPNIKPQFPPKLAKPITRSQAYRPLNRKLMVRTLQKH